MPGLLGLPMALLLFTFREPRRARATTASGAAANAPKFPELFRHISAYRQAPFSIYLAMFLAPVANGFYSWLSSELGPTRGLTAAEICRGIGREWWRERG